jgi:hypothetical protein
VERAFWATANVGPYREFQVVVLDDAKPDDLGWINSGWLREIVAPAPRPRERPAWTTHTRRRRGN